MGRPGGAAKAGDVLVPLTCKCGSVLVLEQSAGEWRCERGHKGTRGERFTLAERVLTMDEYIPERLVRLG